MKTKTGYKGCNVCGEQHHTDFHFILAVSRIFQVHVQAESYAEESQVFSLRQ